MNKEKIMQVNRLTPKVQISALCAGHKRLLPRLSPMITEDGNESQISSNTDKIIITQVICSVNNLLMSKSLPTFKGYIRFNTLVFLKRQTKFSKISLCSHLGSHHYDLRVRKTL